MEITIAVMASEKLCPAQYESMDRSVHLTQRITLPDGSSQEEVDSAIATASASLQMRAEAQLYASLARGIESHGSRPMPWLSAASKDRASRISNPGSISEQNIGKV